jgi:aquaporin Z
MRKYIAELLGTMVLVLIAVGSAVIAGTYIGNVGVSITFGLTLLALVYTIGTISGAHVNPAVTIGALMAGRIKTKDAILYMVFQVIGAIIGAAILFAIASGGPSFDVADGFGANGYDENSPGGYDLTSAILVEVIFTFLFVLVILMSTDTKSFTLLSAERKPTPIFAPFAIGFTLLVIHLMTIPVDNTSVNPARSLGPALFVGDWALEQLWVFILFPLVGGVLAGLVYKYVFETKDVSETKA